jgi:2-keto-3-deoxy-L-rhamnonate aldolase RhmA
MVLISLHALAGVFWAGSTLALTHTSPAHKITPELFRAQMSAAVLAITAGAALWGLVIRGDHGPMANTLAIGALCALAALGAQAAMRRSPVMSQRIAAVLLSVTVVCMVISPYVT